MKGYLTYVLTVVLAVLMSGCTQKAQSPADTAADDGFRMMIRLFPVISIPSRVNLGFKRTVIKYNFASCIFKSF